MDKIKKALIIAIIICLLISIIIVILYFSKNEEKPIYDISKEQLGDKEIKYDKEIVNNSTIFFTIENCINEYFNYASNEDINSLKNILDNEFIRDYNISDDNILEYIDKIDKEKSFLATKMYEQRNDNWYSYIVEGISDNNNYLENLYYIVNIDTNNLTYSIEPLILKKYDDLDDIENICLNYTIEQNENNKFSYYRIKENEIATKYFLYYITILNNNINKAYELLDNNYATRRFDNIEKFTNYINDNKENFENIKIDKYAKYEYDGYNQYVCIDNNGDYYIFNETSVMNYKVFLDTYTIDQPEFIEKYEKATDAEKAGYNINKFMEAINAKDYNYSYNCLAESFKENNFQTLESFKNYAKSTFFNNNEVQYSNSSKEGNYYIYTLTITNADNSSEILQKQFIVNLKENREFELSFEIE